METEKLLRHMAWANEEILTKVSQLPEQALDSFAIKADWTAAEIIRHICSSATWYGWRLLDKSGFSIEEKDAWQKKLDNTEALPTSPKDILEIVGKLKEADHVLFEQSLLPEGVVIREFEGKVISRARSTVISQAIHHATEHRAQLVSALEARGYTGINLDDYDLWSFTSNFGE